MAPGGFAAVEVGGAGREAQVLQIPQVWEGEEFFVAGSGAAAVGAQRLEGGGDRVCWV